MEVLGNTASVRKYYRSHRNEIIKQKTLHACKQEGRIPRLSTMQKHQMQWNNVLQAFAEWQASRPAIVQSDRPCNGSKSRSRIEPGAIFGCA